MLDTNLTQNKYEHVLLLPDNSFNKLTIRIAIPHIWWQEGLVILSYPSNNSNIIYLFQLYVTLHFCISENLK